MSTFPPLWAVSGFWRWLRHLGGPGLILLGIADNSVVPLPGSMDALTIVLAASNRERWWLYAVWATLGAVVGSYFTYRLGEKGGEEALERKFPPKTVMKVRGAFKKAGFWSLAIGAILPPPIPFSPFLVAGGAMEYPKPKFFAAVAIGRMIRYMIVAFIAKTYGSSIFHFFAHYEKPVMYALIGLAAVGSVVGIWYYKKKRREINRKAGKDRGEQPRAA